MVGFVPRLQAAVVASPLVAGNERAKFLLTHPAGPFTSACRALRASVTAARESQGRR